MARGRRFATLFLSQAVEVAATFILRRARSALRRIAGVTDFSSTGGNPDGCGIPHFEELLGGGVTLIPRIVALQVASADAEGLGHFRAWPGGQEQLFHAVLNFAPDHNVSNMILLQMCDEVALTVDELCVLDDGGDFSIQAFISGIHLVIDILGYFHNAEPLL